MPLALVLAQFTAPDLVAVAQARTAAAQRCSPADVTVCGRRAADRLRLPFVVNTPGDPANEGVPAERERLLHRMRPIDGMGPFLIGGGGVGLEASVGTAGHSVRVATLRPPAP